MDDLTYKALDKLGYDGYLLRDAPIRALQFGEGNFLRAFADLFLDLANERAGWNGKILMAQPRNAHDKADILHRQEGLYTVCIRGRLGGEIVDAKRIVSAVADCLCAGRDFGELLAAARIPTLEYVISNTTEAGIVYDGGCGYDDAPPASFPAKLARLLHERYKAGLSGLILLPCELIDNNGEELRRIVRRHSLDWGLEEAFRDWLDTECLFCNTLVDRIVPGGIRDPEEAAAMEEENGYHDAMLTVAEAFAVWYIQGPAWLSDRLPFAGADLPIHVVEDVSPYKKRKVRILNGAHTGMVPAAFLAGRDIVRECMADPVIRGFMERMLQEEVIPVLPLPREDCEGFAAAVTERFDNPFVDHALLSITLNSTSKFRVRNLPSLLEYTEKFGQVPPCLATGLAALMVYLSCDVTGRDKDGLHCRRPDGLSYAAQDEDWVLDLYYEHRADDPTALADAVLGSERMWGQDLREVPGLAEAVKKALVKIRREGAWAALETALRA